MNYFSKGPTTFKIWEMKETSFIADHENLEKSTFDWLAAKLCL